MDCAWEWTSDLAMLWSLLNPPAPFPGWDHCLPNHWLFSLDRWLTSYSGEVGSGFPIGFLTWCSATALMLCCTRVLYFLSSAHLSWPVCTVSASSCSLFAPWASCWLHQGSLHLFSICSAWTLAQLRRFYMNRHEGETDGVCNFTWVGDGPVCHTQISRKWALRPRTWWESCGG